MAPEITGGLSIKARSWTRICATRTFDVAKPDFVVLSGSARYRKCAGCIAACPSPSSVGANPVRISGDTARHTMRRPTPPNPNFEVCVAGEAAPNSAQKRRISAKSCRRAACRRKALEGPIRESHTPALRRSWTSTKPRPHSAKFGPESTNTAFEPDIGSKSSNTEPDIGQSRSTLPRTRPTLARHRPNSARCR